MQLDRESSMARRIRFVAEQKKLVHRLDAGDSQAFLECARSSIEWIRVAVAAHPSASEEVLRILAHDRSKAVRIKVACHQNTPADILNTLHASDGDSVVRGLATRSADGGIPRPSWPPEPP